MDEYYLVAKSKQSGFVTTCTLDQMIQKVSAGELLGEYFATRSSGLSYHQLMRSGVPITWVPAADLIAASDKAAAVQSQAEEHVQEHAKQYLSERKELMIPLFMQLIGVTFIICLRPDQGLPILTEARITRQSARPKD